MTYNLEFDRRALKEWNKLAHKIACRPSPELL
jgi:mRNA-degrading endonuclease RelE of RelBE toxin-antitoxin system